VAVKLSVSRIAAALRRAGRQRNVDQVAAKIKAALRVTQLRQLPLVETAMGRQTLALLAALDAACQSVLELGQAAGELFQTHPDYQIITSFPGLADSAGTRVLAEIGVCAASRQHLGDVFVRWRSACQTLSIGARSVNRTGLPGQRCEGGS